MYLLIFGFAGSPLLHMGFLELLQVGAILLASPELLMVVASLIEQHRL